MARKGERYQQMPTLWYIGWGYPCRVMRKRKGQSRWQNRGYAVLTDATSTRWLRLYAQGKVRIRRDVNLVAAIEFGIVPRPERAAWAFPRQAARVVLAHSSDLTAHLAKGVAP